jgi:hypothetical protein
MITFPEGENKNGLTLTSTGENLESKSLISGNQRSSSLKDKRSHSQHSQQNFKVLLIMTDCTEVRTHKSDAIIPTCPHALDGLTAVRKSRVQGTWLSSTWLFLHRCLRRKFWCTCQRQRPPPVHKISRDSVRWKFSEWISEENPSFHKCVD